MAKKLEGNFFILSANDLLSGKVVFYTKEGWSTSSKNALRIPKDQLENYEKISKIDEDKCIIVSPAFVELDDLGNIRKLRDKIRDKGLTFDLK